MHIYMYDSIHDVTDMINTYLCMGSVVIINIITADDSHRMWLPSVSTSSKAATSLPPLFRLWLGTQHAS